MDALVCGYVIGVNMKRFFQLGLLLLFTALPGLAQSVSVRNAAEIRMALEKLNVLGSALYIAAHPDDENTGLIAFWSNEKKYRAGYLSLTRGDGGQNLIGAEKGSDIGLLRSQELLSARRIDGGEQFFTRAIDFGYSKSMVETLQIWGREKVLADMVWVIRKFRPDVIATRFPTEAMGGGGHGHHTASADLAVEAFKAAGDASRFPEQLQYVQPWQAKRIMVNQWRPGASEELPSYDLGTYNPALGLSYNEIAGRGRSMHKSQGFGTTPASGSQSDFFRLLAGEPAIKDIMEGVDTSWRRLSGGEVIEKEIENILTSYDMKNPATILPALLELDAKMEQLGAATNNQWIAIKRGELVDLIRDCAGIHIEAFAENYAAVPGETVNISVNLIQRTGKALSLEALVFPSLRQRFDVKQDVSDNVIQIIRQSIALPADYPISQPYWLRQPEEKGLFTVEDQTEIGHPENLPTLPVETEVTILGRKITFTMPVRYRWVERAEGEKQRPFEVRPPVTADFTRRTAVFEGSEEKEVVVILKNHAASGKGTVSLTAPSDWTVTPQSIPFEFARRQDELVVTFRVKPPADARRATARAVVAINGKQYSYSLTEIIYPHIDSQVHFQAAELHLVPLASPIKTAAAKSSGKRLGYIEGSGDDIPEILKDMGYEVTMLSDEMLTAATLARLDIVVAGIRAYNTRERLRFVQPLLMDFVKNGGTYIVQYNVNNGLLATEIGPYPFRVGGTRIVEEDAQLRFLDPKHPLLNYPNVITNDDFSDWVQERGLYFTEQWDERYTPIFAGHDTGERDLEGSTLFCRHGKGIFIYTGLAFFRQLPAGVPGAFRLFQNMLSARGEP